eukprot:5895522-Alexandrium_andersonii.AAC.1
MLGACVHRTFHAYSRRLRLRGQSTILGGISKVEIALSRNCNQLHSGTRACNELDSGRLRCHAF